MPSKSFVFRILLSICMVIFISPVVFPSFCKSMFFSFHVFFVFKLVDLLFTFPNQFKVVNFFSDNFALTADDLTDCCMFQF